MKRITLATLLLTSILSQAQVNCTVLSPSSIANSYGFGWADPNNGWGCPDFNIPGTYVQDTLMMVEDGTPGTNTQGNPISQEGCNALINDLSGKIAVCWRNSCLFYEKAINAQNAGAVAVVMINNDNTLVNWAPGAGGANVTIPFINITLSDGLAIVNAMQNNPVVMFIGNGSADVMELDQPDKTLIKIVDSMGRETEIKPNTLLFYVYSDGTTEKVFRVE